jgi:alpha-L-fucosidase
MKISSYILSLFVFAIARYPAIAQQKQEEFEGWGKLKNEVPEWFRDAKFGIYFHWGVYSLPAHNSEWYSRSMYVPGTGPYRHHQATYGQQKNFGYKDFIPMFKAERFNADEWVDLFSRAGAKFTGSIAEHADGFSMWRSKVNPWNAADMGPKRDVVKEMEKAVRKRNLKFIATFHHQWLWGWYPTFDSNVDASEPKNAGLYGPLTSPAAWQHKDTAEKPDKAFSDLWIAKVKEVVTKYKPDILYFDSRLGHLGESYRKEIVSKHFDKNKDDKVVTYKAKDLPDDVGVRTYEKSRINKINERAWLAEEPISTYSWGYTEDMVIRPAQDILHGLIDVVSKNGVYLLNVSPKADGTIPQNQKEVLLAIGNWMKGFGEAIYNTKPWYTYGEGPRKEADEKGENKGKKYFELKYNVNDIRYTTKGNAIYAIVLGSPSEQKNILLKSFNQDSLGEKIDIRNVAVVGSPDKIQWELLKGGLSIKTPARLSEAMAVVFKIETAKD